MKRIIGLLLALVMVMALLAGCGEKQAAENQGNAATETKAVEKEAAGDDAQASEEVVHLVLQIMYFAMEDPDLQKVVDAINEITVPEIGVEISVMTCNFAEMATKPALWQAAGEQVDIIYTGAMTTPQQQAAQGLLYPLDELLADSEILTGISGRLLDALKYDGKIYSIPLDLYPGTAGSYFYDLDLAEQYNIEVPESVSSEAELEAIFKQVKESGMSQYAMTYGDGVLVYSTYGYDVENLGDNYSSYGVILDAENSSTVVNWFETEEYAQFCQLHYDWMQAGYVLPDSLSNGYTYIDSMAQGTIFGFVSSQGASVGKAMYQMQTGKRLGEVKLSEVMIKTSDVATNCWGIAATCEHPEKVIDFWELLYTNPDVANLLNYGIEGEHYVTIEGSSLIAYPEGKDAMTAGYGSLSMAGSIGDRMNMHALNTSWTEEELATVPNYGIEKATISPYYGFNYSLENVATENAAVMATIQKYAMSLNCGVANPAETLPEFIQALKDAGMDKIIADTQAQVDAFNASR